jgi:hypothetical protein
MRYHAPTKGFIVDQRDLEFFALSVPYVIKQIRISAGLPLDKYEMEGGLLSDADHAIGETALLESELSRLNEAAEQAEYDSIVSTYAQCKRGNINGK